MNGIRAAAAALPSQRLIWLKDQSFSKAVCRHKYETSFSFPNDLPETVQSSFSKPRGASVRPWRTSLRALLCFSCVEKWLTSVFAFVAANWQGDKLHVAQGSVVMRS